MKDEQGDRYLIKKCVLKKPQQVMGKMNRMQNMLNRFQQVVDKINKMQKVLDKFQQVMDKKTGCRIC